MGIVDCHFHVIAPPDQAPMAAGRSYTPAPASVGEWGAALAPLSLAPLAGRSSRVVRYRFTARRRGVARLGPLGTTAVDPFGLVRVEQWHAATTEAIVLPRLHPLDPVPPAPGEEPEPFEPDPPPAPSKVWPW